ncbi:MAG: pyrroline-5-carboxylate reductase [Mycobacteriaceae bacterium]|nr:pyrroline-5-carboxylate reductase [Mycobacteriaceae bacterium]
MSRIAIIGGGNIGEALLAGLLRSGRQAKDIVVSERVAARARYLCETYSVPLTGVTEAVDNADFVVVAVKPSDVEPVTAEIGAAFARGRGEAPVQVVVSVAAGVGSAYYESRLPAGTPVIRVMPNAPMVVRAGVTAIAGGRFANQEQLEEVAALFESVGGVLTVPESQIDAVTAVSGSGPAYFFLLVEALVDAGVAAGLSRSVATDLVVQTMAGSAAMLLDRMGGSGRPVDDAALAADVDTTPAQLRATITSPGGTTAAGLAELERAGLRAGLAAAVQAAKTRSEQLRITSE